jgi:hypothetical protein
MDSFSAIEEAGMVQELQNLVRVAIQPQEITADLPRVAVFSAGRCGPFFIRKAAGTSKTPSTRRGLELQNGRNDKFLMCHFSWVPFECSRRYRSIIRKRGLHNKVKGETSV